MTDVKILQALKDEIDPQGTKVDKDDFLGVPVVVQRIKTFTWEGKPAVRIIAILPETGELIHFTGGEPMINSIIEYKDHLPLVCTIATYKNSKGKPYYILE